jgi:hypothetical protein
MIDVQPILTDLINNIKTDVINSMQSFGAIGNGETISQLETLIDNDTGQLIAPFWIWALEFGRKPTSPGAAKGDPTLYQKICVWAPTKGIPEFSTNSKGQTINVWRAITAYIHKNGYPGKPGILTIPVGHDNINSRLNDACEKIANQTGKEVLDLFNVFDTIN